MAALSKVIFPTAKTVDLGAYIPIDSIFFKFIVPPVLFIFNSPTGEDEINRLFANIPAEFLFTTSISPLLFIRSSLSVFAFNFPNIPAEFSPEIFI